MPLWEPTPPNGPSNKWSSPKLLQHTCGSFTAHQCAAAQWLKIATLIRQLQPEKKYTKCLISEINLLQKVLLQKATDILILNFKVIHLETKVQTTCYRETLCSVLLAFLSFYEKQLWESQNWTEATEQGGIVTLSLLSENHFHQSDFPSVENCSSKLF